MHYAGHVMAVPASTLINCARPVLAYMYYNMFFCSASPYMYVAD
jgi:hypothetical protein